MTERYLQIGLGAMGRKNLERAEEARMASMGHVINRLMLAHSLVKTLVDSQQTHLHSF